MFIATAIRKPIQDPEERNKLGIYIVLLRSSKRKQTDIYKHFIPTGFMCPRNLLKKQEVRRRYADSADRIERSIKSRPT